MGRWGVVTEVRCSSLMSNKLGMSFIKRAGGGGGGGGGITEVKCSPLMSNKLGMSFIKKGGGGRESLKSNVHP